MLRSKRRQTPTSTKPSLPRRASESLTPLFSYSRCEKIYVELTSYCSQHCQVKEKVTSKSVQVTYSLRKLSYQLRLGTRATGRSSLEHAQTRHHTALTRGYQKYDRGKYQGCFEALLAHHCGGKSDHVGLAPRLCPICGREAEVGVQASTSAWKSVLIHELLHKAHCHLTSSLPFYSTENMTCLMERCE